MSVVRAAVEKPGRDRITYDDDPAVDEENLFKQVQSQYNGFGQLTAQYQAHGGAVNTSTTPNVEYAYADGSANTIRPTSLTYPNGRLLTYTYGTTDGINDAASRIEALIDDDSTPLAEYEYLGLRSIVEVDYPQPDLRYRLFDPGLSGDIYTSLDRFGRVIDCHWYDYGSSASPAQIKYGYDRASNRIWREDPVAAADGKRFDELYAYDGLQRLKEMQRGTINGGKDAITNLQFEQCWSLDATGNWSGFRSDDDGTGWSLVQQRTANEVNEITGISETTGPSWATPSYDPAGNMTTLPQPSDPTATYAATYDAWNRLVKLTDGEDTVQENQYDARRFRIVRKDYAEGTLDETRHFYYTAGWRSIEERLDSETDPDRQYVWGLRYIDDLVLRDRPDAEERLYGLQDGNWNMIAIADEAGDVLERYAYLVYGFRSDLSPLFNNRQSTIFDMTIGYTGRIHDLTNGLYCFRKRWMNCRYGTFCTRDLIGYMGGINLLACVFSYSSSVDPLGNRPPYSRQQCHGGRFGFQEVPFDGPSALPPTPRAVCINGEWLLPPHPAANWLPTPNHPAQKPGVWYGPWSFTLLRDCECSPNQHEGLKLILDCVKEALNKRNFILWSIRSDAHKTPEGNSGPCSWFEYEFRQCFEQKIVNKYNIAGGDIYEKAREMFERETGINVSEQEWRTPNNPYSEDHVAVKIEFTRPCDAWGEPFVIYFDAGEFGRLQGNLGDCDHMFLPRDVDPTNYFPVPSPPRR